MKKVVLIFAAIVGLCCCGGDKAQCWTLTISSFGLTEERLFWGTESEVEAEVNALLDVASEAGVETQIGYEKSNYVKSSCW